MYFFTLIKIVIFSVAHVVEDFRKTAVSASSLTLSWSHPSIAAHLTTGYNLTCVSLLAGIPVPQSLWLPPTTISATVTELRPGVLYNCTIFTITDQGSSPPLTLSLITSETGILQLRKACMEKHVYSILARNTHTQLINSDN